MYRGAVGIHLGNTESCVAIYTNKKLEIIENELGQRFTPSVVTFTEHSVLTGPESIIQRNPTTTIFETRELIGRKFTDREVQEFIKLVPYTVVNDLGQPKIKIDLPNCQTRGYYVEEISAFILSRMKCIAEARLQSDVTTAVVTVPASFTKAQRDTTTEAALMAGFKTVKIIEEPVAAALAFDHGGSKRYRRNIVVYDFGRQTCNVSIVTIEKGQCMTRLTKTDGNLGGKDIEENVNIIIKDDFTRKFGNDIQEFPHGILTTQIKDQSNRAKKALSNIVLYEIEFLSKWNRHKYKLLLPRSRFEQKNKQLFTKTIQIVDESLQECRLGVEDIDEVILVGGSSRIPKIQQLLQEHFGKDKINTTVNPTEAMVYGAAIYASKMFGDKYEVIVDDV